MELTLRQKQLAALLVTKDNKYRCTVNRNKFGYIKCEDCLAKCPKHAEGKKIRVNEALKQFTKAEILTILLLKEAIND